MLKYSTGERLRQIMSERNLKQVDVVKMCEPLCKKYKVRLGKNDLSQYISGKVEPRQNKLYILASTLNVSEAWLMGYDVSPERLSETPETITEDEKLLLSKYSRLNKSGKTKTHDYIDDLLDNDKYIAPIKQTIAAHGADETEGTDQPPIPETVL